MRTFAFFRAKNFGFFEIYAVSVRTREVEPVTKGRGQFFAILCGRPLWTAPKINKIKLNKTDKKMLS